MNTENNYASHYYSDVFTDINVLEKNVQDYPASSVARFLLLYQLKKNNDPRFGKVARQTGIYFHNPQWIEYQLSQLSIEPEINFSNNSNVENPDKENITLEPTEVDEQFVETVVVSPEEKNAAAEVDNANDIELVDQKETGEKSILPVNEEITENLHLETESPDKENEEIAEEINEEINTENDTDLIEQKLQDEEFPLPVNEEIIENLPFETESSDNKNEEVAGEIKEESVENNSTEEVPVVEEENQFLPAEEMLAGLEEQENKTDFPSENEETEFNTEESVFNAKIPEEKEEENPSGEESTDSEENDDEDDDLSIPFEPLHTVDYFASQGIKLTEEALNNDQLGKQVKSFTAWLKSMKKLHPGQLPEQNEVIEKLIQTSSEASNKNANVLTEAMAEVLVKQGKREKAIEMYEKLSLINPSKSAYFAAKIESLKII